MRVATSLRKIDRASNHGPRRVTLSTSNVPHSAGINQPSTMTSFHRIHRQLYKSHPLIHLHSLTRRFSSTMPPSTDVDAFHEVLRSSKRILALCGAGLSASSGLPTFRGAGGLWRNYDATTLATPTAFGQDPGLVWMFYGYRRHMALNVKPNPAHYALAALAEKNKDFLCLTQNVDNLSPRANHPQEQLRTLHGSLFDIKCSNGRCDWIQHGNYDDPFFPALAPASEDPEDGKPFPLLDPFHPLEPIPKDQIPKCPKCGKGFQRPGVVWFNEGLDMDMLDGIDKWLDEGKVDLMLVIGTSAKVWPAAGYIDQARGKGARVAVINMEAAKERGKDSNSKDFFFGQDAAECLPLLLEPIIGKLEISNQ